jgi:membrane protease YdiL (CAAX protease family)
MMPENFKKAALFSALACALAWGLLSAFAGLGGKWNTPYAVPVGVAMMYVPLLSALIVQKLVWREPFWREIGVSFRPNRWFLVAWFLMPLVALAAFGLSLLVPGVEFAPDSAGMFERFKDILTPEQMAQMRKQLDESSVHPFVFTLLSGLTAGLVITALAAFGEEAGWRGFLLKQLAPLGFWKSSLLTGAIWGVWHFPVILMGHNYPQHPAAGVLLMIVFCLLLAPLHTYIRLKARSVIGATILHAGVNANGGLAIMLVKGGSDLTAGITGLPGLAVLALANVGLFVFDRYVTKEPVAALLADLAAGNEGARERP